MFANPQVRACKYSTHLVEKVFARQFSTRALAKDESLNHNTTKVKPHVLEEVGCVLRRESLSTSLFQRVGYLKGIVEDELFNEESAHVKICAISRVAAPVPPRIVP